MHTLHAFAHVLSSVSNMYEHEFQAKCMSRQQCVRDEECALPEFYLGGGGAFAFLWHNLAALKTHYYATYTMQLDRALACERFQ